MLVILSTKLVLTSHHAMYGPMCLDIKYLLLFTSKLFTRMIAKTMNVID